jgi:hypothetical protein
VRFRIIVSPPLLNPHISPSSQSQETHVHEEIFNLLEEIQKKEDFFIMAICFPLLADPFDQ